MNCPADKLCPLAIAKIEALEEKCEFQLRALDQSIQKSESILSVRLEEMNNFRKQINDERMLFVSRRETILLNFLISSIVVILGAIFTYELMK